MRAAIEEIDELLDVLESMARQHCRTDKDGMTDSGAMPAPRSDSSRRRSGLTPELSRRPKIDATIAEAEGGKTQ